MNDSNKLEFVLFPPKDGVDSDVDDAPSDDEEEASLRTIGKGVLRQPMEIFSVNTENERDQVILTVTEENKSNEGYETDSSLDDAPLATLFAKELKDKEIRESIKKRKWKTKNFACNLNKITIPASPAPDITKKIEEEKLQQIDLFKMFYHDTFMQFVCNEMEKMQRLKAAMNLE